MAVALGVLTVSYSSDQMPSQSTEELFELITGASGGVQVVADGC